MRVPREYTINPGNSDVLAMSQVQNLTHTPPPICHWGAPPVHFHDLEQRALITCCGWVDRAWVTPLPTVTVGNHKCLI